MIGLRCMLFIGLGLLFTSCCDLGFVLALDWYLGIRYLLIDSLGVWFVVICVICLFDCCFRFRGVWLLFVIVLICISFLGVYVIMLLFNLMFVVLFNFCVLEYCLLIILICG